MRRSKRQHSPEEEWVEDGYGSQRKEEAQTTKRPRRSSPVEEAELKDTSPRKNHHGKTYERCRQITNRPHPALQSKAREPRRGVGAWDRTRAMGTLIRTGNGKDMEVPVCHGARTETNINTGGHPRPQTLAHSDAHLHSVHTQQKRSGGTKRKSCGGDGEGHLVYDAGLLLNER
ncbi:unnamed protein product, partial [Arctogadus glacialis]